jgi:hypothetical protein
MKFRPYRNAVSIRGPDTVAGMAFRVEPYGVSWIEAQHRRGLEVATIEADEPETLVVRDVEGQAFVFVPLTVREWNTRIRQHSISQAEARGLDKLLDDLDREW